LFLLQAEDAITRGTPVTVESFKSWKAKFDKELAIEKAREDEEKLKGLTPKEREEWKKVGTRLSGRFPEHDARLVDAQYVMPVQGRQLFERDKNLEEGTLTEEGTSVDISQYERMSIEEEQDEDERVTFSDSD
jgi:hypothetical protein